MIFIGNVTVFYLVESTEPPPTTTVDTPTEPSVECPPNQCYRECGSSGFKVDENGCEICECLYEDESASRPNCPPTCLMYCPHGFVRDADGCEQCRCAEPPPNKPRSRATECRPLRCRKNCEYGFKTDDNGCEICQCNDAPVVSNPCDLRPACAIRCPDGFQVDSDGCNICSCVEPTANPSCALKPMCNMYCENGFQKDADEIGRAHV